MKNWYSITFIFLLYSCQIEVGIEKQNESAESDHIEPRHTDPLQVELFLTTENVVLWNDVQIDTVHLQDSLKNLINRSIESGHRQIELDTMGFINKTHYIIIIDRADNHSEEIYSRISDIINNSIEIVREEQSQLIYHLSFAKLSNEQQSCIERVVEKCVMEPIHNNTK